VIATVASCIGVGFVLQGCGDGGSSGGDKTKCLADKMDMVTQTMRGVTEISTDATVNGTTVTTTMTGSFMEMFDLENFNMREETSSQVELQPNETMETNVTIILNLGKKQIIGYTSIADKDGKPIEKKCEIQEIDTPWTPEKLSGIFKTVIKPTLQGAAACGGNDGTYDTWKFNKTYSGPLPQTPDSPVPPGMDNLMIKDGSFTEELQMTKDALLHASVTNVNGEVLNGTVSLGKMAMKASMNVSDAKAGGPSADDLDPSKFDVNCTPANTSVDLEFFLRSPGFARQQLLSIVEASKQSEDDTLMV